MFIGVYLWFHSLPVFCAVKMGVQWAGSAPNEDLDHVNQLATINGRPAAKHPGCQRQNIEKQYDAWNSPARSFREHKLKLRRLGDRCRYPTDRSTLKSTCFGL